MIDVNNFSLSDYSLNNSYNLQRDRVNTLVDTLKYCLTNLGWGYGVTAVRMDFSVSNEQNSLYDIPTVDVYKSFDYFLNRLRRKKLNGATIRFVANWKKEYSPEKERHIHTVFYFNRRMYPSLTSTTKLFEVIKELWEHHSYNPALNSVGYVNLVPSYLSKTENRYQAHPLTHSDECFQNLHYYTILTNAFSIYEALSRISLWVYSLDIIPS